MAEAEAFFAGVDFFAAGAAFLVAEPLLATTGFAPALVELALLELARLAASFFARGFGAGDVVAAFVPVAFFAAAGAMGMPSCTDAETLRGPEGSRE